MKKINILFWIAAGLFAAFMIFSAYSYAASEEIKSTFAFWGFPDNLRTGLASAKFLGGSALILLFVSKHLKTAAYAGFGISLVSALVVQLSFLWNDCLRRSNARFILQLQGAVKTEVGQDLSLKTISQ